MCNRLGLVYFTLMLVVAGCHHEYPPVTTTVKDIKSGTTLDDIKKKLGEPHSPSAAQAKQIADTIAAMPEPMRTNAQNDRSLAWGNDSAFFVVKVNDQGIAWVTSWRE